MTCQKVTGASGAIIDSKSVRTSENRDAGENVCDIGEIVAGNELSWNDGERVTLPGLDAAWPV